MYMVLYVEVCADLVFCFALGAVSVASRATTKLKAAVVRRTTLSNKPSNSGQSVSTDEVEKDEETTNAESSTGRSTSGREYCHICHILKVMVFKQS